ncbi:uncharacterized protein LOC121840854 [Oncorhynchus tshawytscha]|uniref:uncharacterized protein LOC121840854 n=1 Tax=Oncorhynchus tshawytscha TaxID=74940 RepID=UPI001C3C45CE|nr:uncharacterized protein LOC121840854 [Oncorhynchus tshawytscha]
MPPRVLSKYYPCTFDSVLTRCITAWYGKCSVHYRKARQRVAKKAQYITGIVPPPILDINSKWCLRKSCSIIKDTTHPSHEMFTHLLLSMRNLAIGIGIQNYPEGLAVSLPLRGAGMSTWKAFWYGQLSGMVEPIAGLLGAVAMVLVEPLLPYALAFAAGAMVYVVVDDIIPEAQLSVLKWERYVGFLDLHPGLCSDDVTGRWAGLRLRMEHR